MLEARRKCGLCRQVKDAADFYPATPHRCKDCHRAYCRELYRRTPRRPVGRPPATEPGDREVAEIERRTAIVRALKGRHDRAVPPATLAKVFGSDDPPGC